MMIDDISDKLLSQPGNITEGSSVAWRFCRRQGQCVELLEVTEWEGSEPLSPPANVEEII